MIAIIQKTPRFANRMSSLEYANRRGHSPWPKRIADKRFWAFHDSLVSKLLYLKLSDEESPLPSHEFERQKISIFWFVHGCCDRAYELCRTRYIVRVPLMCLNFTHVPPQIGGMLFTLLFTMAYKQMSPALIGLEPGLLTKCPLCWDEHSVKPKIYTKICIDRSLNLPQTKRSESLILDRFEAIEKHL